MTLDFFLSECLEFKNIVEDYLIEIIDFDDKSLSSDQHTYIEWKDGNDTCIFNTVNSEFTFTVLEINFNKDFFLNKLNNIKFKFFKNEERKENFEIKYEITNYDWRSKGLHHNSYGFTIDSIFRDSKDPEIIFKISIHKK